MTNSLRLGWLTSVCHLAVFEGHTHASTSSGRTADTEWRTVRHRWREVEVVILRFFATRDLLLALYSFNIISQDFNHTLNKLSSQSPARKMCSNSQLSQLANGLQSKYGEGSCKTYCNNIYQRSNQVVFMPPWHDHSVYQDLKFSVGLWLFCKYLMKFLYTVGLFASFRNVSSGANLTVGF